MERIGENIKSLREERAWTQTDLSKVAGVGVKYISAIERGARNPGKKIIAKLCEAFAVDEKTVCFGERKEEKPQLPEHLRLLHDEIDRVIPGVALADQYVLAAKVIELLRGVKTQKNSHRAGHGQRPRLVALR